jgi:uncharacterized protein YceK
MRPSLAETDKSVNLPYPATRGDAEIIAGPFTSDKYRDSQWEFFWPMIVFDLPFSLALDSALFPYDVYYFAASRPQSGETNNSARTGSSAIEASPRR